jgi:hypothetical protein
MYLCLKGIDCASFYDFDILFYDIDILFFTILIFYFTILIFYFRIEVAIPLTHKYMTSHFPGLVQAR